KVGGLELLHILNQFPDIKLACSKREELRIEVPTPLSAAVGGGAQPVDKMAAKFCNWGGVGRLPNWGLRIYDVTTGDDLEDGDDALTLKPAEIFYINHIRDFVKEQINLLQDNV